MLQRYVEETSAAMYYVAVIFRQGKSHFAMKCLINSKTNPKYAGAAAGAVDP
jgi:hypothetical protein